MIKVFTTGSVSRHSGDELTKMFEDWVKTFSPDTVEILGFHTNSNKFGWSLTVHYKIIKYKL
jgi:hypothetical protein